MGQEGFKKPSKNKTKKSKKEDTKKHKKRRQALHEIFFNAMSSVRQSSISKPMPPFSVALSLSKNISTLKSGSNWQENESLATSYFNSI